MNHHHPNSTDTTQPSKSGNVYTHDTQLQEDHRPMDWQDKLVIAGGLLTAMVCLGILLWKR
jgi:hypothetical protein